MMITILLVINFLAFSKGIQLQNKNILLLKKQKHDKLLTGCFYSKITKRRMMFTKIF